MITDVIHLKLVFLSCKYTSTFLESYMLYITKLMQTWSLCSPVAMYLWNQMPKQTQNSFNITAALTSQQTLQGIHDILCKCFTYLRGVWAHVTCPVNSYRLANTITIYMIASTWSKVHMAGIILRLVAGSMCMWCTVGEPENKAIATMSYLLQRTLNTATARQLITTSFITWLITLFIICWRLAASWYPSADTRLCQIHTLPLRPAQKSHARTDATYTQCLVI